ncbi:MAG: TPM domain-containing protein [Cryomorphaceae bacterium]|nr:TPM domain-containing protein [Cryomorphaceae bacterium]
MDKTDIYEVFDDSARQLLVDAIAEAELNTSGEVRIHIDKTCKGSHLDRAAFIFEELEMHKTADRNGVLIYFALNDRKFAIIGDVGINAKVPVNFWDSSRDAMKVHFQNEDYVGGLCAGARMAGVQLKSFFPYQSDDVNELSDEISFGD